MTSKDTLQEAVRLIEEIVAALARGIPEEEVRNGWTEEDRAYFSDFFARLRRQILGEEVEAPIDLEHLVISRMMDDRGLSKGRLVHDAAAVSNLIRENHPKWPRRVRPREANGE